MAGGRPDEAPAPLPLGQRPRRCRYGSGGSGAGVKYLGHLVALGCGGCCWSGVSTAARDVGDGGGPALLHARQLRLNNEVAGFKFATVGVLYAVLLAFAVVVVWEKFNEAENQVATEAGAAVDALPAVAGHGRRTGRGARARRLRTYLARRSRRTGRRWQPGAPSPDATRALNDVYAAVLRFRPVEPGQQEALDEVLYQLDQVDPGAARPARHGLGIVPGILWLVLFVGAVVTVGFTFFFGSENLKAQAMMTGALSLLIFSGLLVIVAIDRPFAGAVARGARAADRGAGGVRRAGSAVAGRGELDVEEARVERDAGGHIGRARRGCAGRSWW